jgi:hypothetical protein
VAERDELVTSELAAFAAERHVATGGGAHRLVEPAKLRLAVRDPSLRPVAAGVASDVEGRRPADLSRAVGAGGRA